jgi:excisionase family DNA binding protein
MVNQSSKVEWVTPLEVAAALQVSSAAVYRWVKDGSVPAFVLGHVIRIPAWWLEDTLDRYRKGQSVEEYSTDRLAELGRQYMQAIAVAQRLDLA